MSRQTNTWYPRRDLRNSPSSARRPRQEQPCRHNCSSSRDVHQTDADQDRMMDKNASSETRKTLDKTARSNRARQGPHVQINIVDTRATPTSRGEGARDWHVDGCADRRRRRRPDAADELLHVKARPGPEPIVSETRSSPGAPPNGGTTSKLFDARRHRRPARVRSSYLGLNGWGPRHSIAKAGRRRAPGRRRAGEEKLPVGTGLGPRHEDAVRDDPRTSRARRDPDGGIRSM